MRILWWYHLLAFIPSFYVFSGLVNSISRNAPYKLFLLFLIHYIPLAFSEPIYESLSILFINLGFEEKLLKILINWFFTTQIIFDYSWYIFWIFGLISALISFNIIKKSDYWLSWSGLFNSLSLLFYYSSSSFEYLLIYAASIAIYINWGYKIKHYVIEVNEIFYIYNFCIFAIFLIPTLNFFIPGIDVISWIIWILIAGLVVGVPIMIFIYFCTSFGMLFNLLQMLFRSISQKDSENNNYLHDGEHVLSIFQYYFFISICLFAMLLTANVFEEILGAWNRILIELFYIIIAAVIGNALLYPGQDLIKFERFNLQTNILGVYIQLWWLRILINFCNRIEAPYAL